MNSSEQTALIQAPTFSKSGRAWRPFRHTNLEKVSKRHARLVSHLEWMFPTVASVGEVAKSVGQRLEAILEESVSVETQTVHLIPPGSVRRYLSDPTFLAVLAAQPHKARGLLEVELGLAHRVIDLLLGGSGEAVGIRPLTDIEEGVLTYVVIEMLQVLTPALDASLPRLRSEGVVNDVEDAVGLLAEQEYLGVLQLKVQIGSSSGYVRLLIPESVLATAVPPADGALVRVRRQQAAAAHATRLGSIRTTLRAEIGNVDISAQDLSRLRVKDVVLVDALSCRPDLGQGGTARFRLAAGRAGHFEASVEIDSGRFRATLGSLVMGSSGMAGEEGNQGRAHVEEAQNSSDGADLLSDIPLHLSVEIGRVALTGEEVVSLKAGQVFDLNRVSGEPLDLSVNGRIVARGELVEIDGNLGVRIVTLGE